MEIVSEYFSGTRCDLATMDEELKRQADTKLDFCVDTRCCYFDFEENPDGLSGLVLRPEPTGGYDIGEFIGQGIRVRDQALTQICNTPQTDVPVKFMRKLLVSQPDTACRLINDLWYHEPSRRFFRTLDGQLRAVLSSSYRVLDNTDMFFAALDVAREHGAKPIEANLTDRNMRLKLVNESLWDTVKDFQRGPKGSWYAGGLGNQSFLSKVGARTKGDLPGGPDTVFPCLTIGNSETGNGGSWVRLGLLGGICFNLATVEQIISKVHLGSKMDEGIYSEKTRQMQDNLTMSAVQDAIRSGFCEKRFKRIVAKANDASDKPIEEPTDAVDNIVQAHGLTEDMKTSILEHFLSDYHKTQLGLSQAVARAAQDVESPDAADALELVAGKVLVA